ncbi:MAG: hypothetical protein E4H02_00855 [Lentisphaerales bacterium]|jgi:hypothetical protein|nr:MAG: hypothetical protein E4H02_00855 [Lentisphaerales bacterium]
MRTYLAMTNLARAGLLAFIVAIMAVPRIMQGGPETRLLRIAMIFPVATIIAGAVTAWGGAARMAGPFPERGRMLKGLWMAVLAGVLITPILLWTEGGIIRELRANDNQAALRLMYPAGVGACFALILWGAGFETLFFRASAISLLARVTGRQLVAVVGTVLFRVLVSAIQFSEAGLHSSAGLRLTGVALLSVISCLFYVRAGLPATMMFAATLDARHLVRLATGLDFS